MVSRSKKRSCPVDSFSRNEVTLPLHTHPCPASDQGVQALNPISLARLQCDKYSPKACLLSSGHYTRPGNTCWRAFLAAVVGELLAL